VTCAPKVAVNRLSSIWGMVSRQTFLLTGTDNTTDRLVCKLLKTRKWDSQNLRSVCLGRIACERAAGAALVRERNRNTFSDDIKQMPQRYLTFGAAIQSKEFGPRAGPHRQLRSH